uniref:Uncharacterized protein n=1 Tax=Anguilla anguilla TaxID=7936 RepID=A0A0E9XHJ7_ANGAN
MIKKLEKKAEKYLTVHFTKVSFITEKCTSVKLVDFFATHIRTNL